uniref:Uncharacterized protein n=1 Tax=Rhizophora mucronata TaxID=61149 RepID=A0A2P2PLG2_RHIMU
MQKCYLMLKGVCSVFLIFLFKILLGCFSWGV